MSVVQVRVVVLGHHHPVGELASGESLHGFLAVAGRDVLHEDLQEDTGQSEPSDHLPVPGSARAVKHPAAKIPNWDKVPGQR